MSAQPDVTTPTADQQLSRATRLTVVLLGCLALAFGGAGVAFAAPLDDDGLGDTEDSVWVTVVGDDRRSSPCPARAAEATAQDGDGL